MTSQLPIHSTHLITRVLKACIMLLMDVWVRVYLYMDNVCYGWYLYVIELQLGYVCMLVFVGSWTLLISLLVSDNFIFLSLLFYLSTVPDIGHPRFLFTLLRSTRPPTKVHAFQAPSTESLSNILLTQRGDHGITTPPLPNISLPSITKNNPKHKHRTNTLSLTSHSQHVIIKVNFAEWYLSLPFIASPLLHHPKEFPPHPHFPHTIQKSQSRRKQVFVSSSPPLG